MIVFNRLHVGNLAVDTTATELEALFARHGVVTAARVVTDQHSGRSRGYGFVDMATAEQAKAAIDRLDGFAIAGRQLTVAIAKPRSR
jgi:cold-inducible RNA-binding protein